MKVLKLSVDYDGYYGGNLQEHMLLPLEVKGLYQESESLDEGVYKNAVYLGEIEGKHSEVYDDLTISVVDLDELSFLDRVNLINDSDDTQFEYYLECAEEEFKETYEELSDSEKEDLEFQRNSVHLILEKYEADKYDWINQMKIHTKFIQYLKEKYKTNVSITTIQVNEEDLQAAETLLINNGINIIK